MSALLVTGGAGFIGSNFVHHWIGAHPEDRVVVLDSLTYAGNPDNLRELAECSRFSFVHGDIRDHAQVEQLLREEGIDTVVHFAAESHVDRSIVGPDAFLDTNVHGTHELLKTARLVWLDGSHTVATHRFHHVSTDEVYGSLGPDDPPFHERCAYAPSSPYAASKAASDMLVRAYHRTYGLQVTISNCSNNYGPRHFPEKLIPLMIVNVLQGKQLPLYGSGANIRDWLFVTDHCRGIEAVLARGRIGETYNIGGRCERSNVDVVEALCELIDAEFDARPHLRARFPDAPPSVGRQSRHLIRSVADRPGHDFRYAIDSRKIESELAFAAWVPFEEGLRATVRWYLDNARWWRAILDGSYRASQPLRAGRWRTNS